MVRAPGAPGLSAGPPPLPVHRPLVSLFSKGTVLADSPLCPCAWCRPPHGARLSPAPLLPPHSSWAAAAPPCHAVLHHPGQALLWFLHPCGSFLLFFLLPLGLSLSQQPLVHSWGATLPHSAFWNLPWPSRTLCPPPTLRPAFSPSQASLLPALNTQPGTLYSANSGLLPEGTHAHTRMHTHTHQEPRGRCLLCVPSLWYVPPGRAHRGHEELVGRVPWLLILHFDFRRLALHADPHPGDLWGGRFCTHFTPTEPQSLPRPGAGAITPGLTPGGLGPRSEPGSSHLHTASLLPTAGPQDMRTARLLVPRREAPLQLTESRVRHLLRSRAEHRPSPLHRSPSSQDLGPLGSTLHTFPWCYMPPSPRPPWPPRASRLSPFSDTLGSPLPPLNERQGQGQKHTCGLLP